MIWIVAVYNNGVRERTLCKFRFKQLSSFFTTFLQVCHGDIKLENLLITSWHWLLLADFASYKPTYLPDDNPADFSYFFDTSRRRTCYLAPERFVKSTTGSSEMMSHNMFVDEGGVEKGELTPTMDIFSAG